MDRAERHAASSSDDGRYRLLVDAITDYAIYMLDLDGTVTSWNPGAQRFKGYLAGEIIGRSFSEFYTEADRAAGRPAAALAAASNEGRFEGEGWRVRKDGSRFWAHVVIDPIRNPAGTLIGFAKITRDLTERKLAEESLRRSEVQFRMLVQGVTDYAIYMLDAQGRVSNWNEGARRIKGYTAEEIVGQHFSRFYTEEDRAVGMPWRALDIAERTGRFEQEAQRVRKDGTRFWAHVVIDPIRDDMGGIVGFAKITRDITERRETQQALERAREQLFQSQKLEAIGQLTGGIAHDFNNLLMVVLGSLQLIRKRLPDDSRLMPLVENAVQGAERGVSLTQRMLAFARRQDLNPQPVDLPSLVGQMNDLLQRSLGPALVIETRFPEQLPPALTDANQLEAALLNLVVNARDAMPDGGSVIIAARKETLTGGDSTGLPAGHYVCVSVTDSGEGMDEATLTRAMDPFFTTKGVGKGTGLGLSMVQGLAEQSGGRLVLKSRPGHGTTAEIWLKVANSSAQPFQPGASAPTLSAEPITILAVDDDNLVLRNTAAMLTDLGHTVFEADSGEAALAILREYRVDLVLTDHAMPRMTGAQLADLIKAEWPAMPVILATGYAELPPGAATGRPRLAKPFSQDEVTRAMSDALALAAATAVAV